MCKTPDIDSYIFLIKMHLRNLLLEEAETLEIYGLVYQ